MSHLSKSIIAIDGPAASGKGTLARRLAEALNFAYLDTGTLYRAVAWEVLKRGGDPANKQMALEAAETLQLKIKSSGKPSEILDNPDLRNDEVGTAASRVAAMPAVRKALLNIQRDFAKNPGEQYQGAVLDGRDIGTVICPDADLKLFITASDAVRAQRRLKELQSRGIPAKYEAVLADMRKRDARDAHTLSPHRGPGYKTNVIDTSDLNPNQVFEKVLKLAKATGL